MMARAGDSSIPLSISLDSGVPLYEQVEAQVRQLIIANIISAGTTLPSVRALATDLGCSVITTRRAYQELEQQGLIRTLPGRGTIVAEVTDDVRRQYRLAPVQHALQQALQEARAAGLSRDDLHQLLDRIAEDNLPS